MNKKNSRRNPQNTNSNKSQPPSGRPVLEDNVKALRELVAAIREETDRQKKEAKNPNSSPERQIDEQKRSSRIAITSTRISQKALLVSKWALVINIAYFVVTGLIFYLTIHSVGAANKSVRISDSALAETRNEFTLINEPFLQIDSPKVSPVSPLNRNVAVFFQITNLKSIAVKIYGLATAVAIDSVPKFMIPFRICKCVMFVTLLWITFVFL